MLGFFQFERRKFNVYKYKTCSAYTIADHVSACLLTSFFAQKFFEIVNICTLKEICYKIDLLVLALLRWYNRLFAISLIN